MQSGIALLDSINGLIRKKSLIVHGNQILKGKNSVTCCFIGNTLTCSENDKSEITVEIKNFLLEEIEVSAMLGYKNFITGLDGQIDLLAAEIILELIEKGYDIKLYCAIPYLKQASSDWNNEHLERYFVLLKKCTNVYLLSTEYDTSCLAICNKVMIDSSSHIISVLSNVPSRTSLAINYADKNKLSMRVYAANQEARAYLQHRKIPCSFVQV